MFAMPMLMKPAVGGGNLSDAVEAILTSDKGFVLDFTDASVMWEESTKTTQVTTVGDPIGAIDSKFGTASPITIISSTANIGTWTGTAWEGDGVDDHLLVNGGSTTLADVPAITYVTQFNLDSIAAGPVLIGWSTNATTNARFQVVVNSSGALVLQIRRLDADSLNTFTSATGLISTGTTYTLFVEVDYAGTGDIEAFLDGSSILTGTLAGTPANTSNTSSPRARFHFAINNGILAEVDGKVGRTFLGTALLSSGDAADVVAWVEEFAL